MNKTINKENINIYKIAITVKACAHYEKYLEDLIILDGGQKSQAVKVLARMATATRMAMPRTTADHSKKKRFPFYTTGS